MRAKQIHHAIPVAALLGLSALTCAPAHAQGADAFTGRVVAPDGSPMEGVPVSAKKDGSTITTSVVSDQTGAFRFPAGRLAPGHYAISIRAVGYDLPATAADVGPGAPTTSVVLKLEPTKDVSAQLTNAEWLASMPGDDAQKKFLLNCNSCHTYDRIVRSTYDANGFLKIFQLMAGFYPGSTPLHPQLLVGDARRNLSHGADAQKVAEWLSTVNLSKQKTWSYPLKTMPRLTGRSTHEIVTEYDLPSKLIEPHDVIVDRAGKVWFSDFGEMKLGELDPESGKTTEYDIPVTKQGFPTGSLDLEVDADDNLWLGMMYQASIVKFDQKTKTFQVWSIPKAWDSDAAQFGHLAVYGTPADGKVWIKNSNGNHIYRLDLATNAFEDLGSFKDPNTGKKIGAYGIHSDSHNNLYLLDFSGGDIGVIDAKTKAFSDYETPTLMSRPRRGRVDAQNRLWFAEYGSNAIGMFDPSTKRMQEWQVPTAWTAPYDVVFDKFGDAWSGSMMTDRVQRLNVATGEYTEYPLPRPTNVRRVFVDETKSPGALWIGSNHGASIVKVEPLD